MYTPRHVGTVFTDVNNSSTRGLLPIDIQRAAYGQDVLPLTRTVYASAPQAQLPTSISLRGVMSIIIPLFK